MGAEQLSSQSPKRKQLQVDSGELLIENRHTLIQRITGKRSRQDKSPQRGMQSENRDIDDVRHADWSAQIKSARSSFYRSTASGRRLMRIPKPSTTTRVFVLPECFRSRWHERWRQSAALAIPSQSQRLHAICNQQQVADEHSVFFFIAVRPAQ